MKNAIRERKSKVLGLFLCFLLLGIADRYQAALFRKEGIHFYKDSEGTFNAGIVEVEADGHLVLQDETGKIRRYLFKEVQYIL